MSGGENCATAKVKQRFTDELIGNFDIVIEILRETSVINHDVLARHRGAEPVSEAPGQAKEPSCQQEILRYQLDRAKNLADVIRSQSREFDEII